MGASKAEPIEKLAVSIKEAVAMIGLSRSHLYRLMATGELPTVKIGGRRLVPIENLKRLVGLTAE